MNVVRNAIIAVDKRIRDNFVKRLRWISDFFQSFITHLWNALDDFNCQLHGILNLLVKTSLDSLWSKFERLPETYSFLGSVAINFNPAVFGYERLRLVGEQYCPSDGGSIV